MNKNIMYFLTLLIIITIISSCSPLPTIVVSGRIIDTNNYPVYNAMVTVEGKTTYTNNSGYFSLNVRENSYVKLEIAKPGYWSGEKIFSVQTFNKNIGTIQLVDKKGNSASVSGYIIVGPAASIQSISNMEFPQVSLQNRENRKQLEYVEGEVLVEFKENTNIYDNVSGSFIKDRIPLNEEINLYKIISNGKLSTEELYDYYSKLESVEKVSYNYIGYLMSTPNDSYYGAQWYLENINMPAAWNKEKGSKSVTVAVIDTGYLPHHDLMENIDRNNEWDFVDNDNYAYDDDANRANSASHGTHVAGIIGAVGDNGRGIAGVNWKINILPLRVFEGDYCRTDRLVDAIYYAVDKGASVINLSLAYDTETSLGIVEDALKYAYNSGVTVIAAAGNSHENCVFYPASSDYTIAVGATNIENKLTPYSNYGVGLDILAPGGNFEKDPGILSTSKYMGNYNDYVYMTGTSAAAPQVSGVAALLVACGIRGPYEIKDILTGTSTPLYDHRLNGAGLLNAAAALGETPDYNFYLDVKIFAVYEEGDIYYLVSNITGADYEGKYNLAYVEPYRDLKIIAWIDENEDNIINGKDWVGESEPLSLSNNEHREIDTIYIEYQSTLSIQQKSVEQINQVLRSQ